jgi:tetratricopeptide (TPR) repeat protein
MISKRQQGSEEEIPHDEPSLSSSNNLTGPYLGAGSQTGESSPASTTVAGRNLLFEEIGRGGMGAVFKGRDTELGRELAVKVLLDDHRDRPELIRRFLEEAQIAGQLQHPGVAPVYELGRCPDNRPYFTMKLVQGHTLSELLRQRADIHQDVGKFLGIFAQVCQTVAYAHSQGVIHRDLKPSNIMVGGFGEVQVMDWGLAKVLRPEPAERAETAEGDGTPGVQPNGSGSTMEESRTGIVGTPAYMPPEQARGDAADERADVFSLGAILCEILTGRAVYTGSRQALWSKVQGVELGEAFTRLERCGADAELIGLARRCLAAQRDERSRHAGEVAEAVVAYLAAVEARARQAEQERAAAAARAEEAKATAAAERRAKRMTVGLAVAALLLAATGGSVAWIVQQQHAVALARKQEAERRAVDRMDQARVLLDAGWQANDLTKLVDARANAEQATEIANGADESIREKAAQLHDEVKARIEATDKNRALLTALLMVTESRETQSYQKGGGVVGLPNALLTVDEQFAAAFRLWEPDLDFDRNTVDEIVTRFESQPESVVQEVVSGLDTWALERAVKRQPEAKWRRLFDVAERLDHLDRRRELRRLLSRAGRSSTVRSDSSHQTKIRAELGQLSGKVDVYREPVLGLLALARVLEAVGEARKAETLLRSAVAIHRSEGLLLYELGKQLEHQKPPRLAESIEWYRAACAVRPRLGVALAVALGSANRAAEGEAILRDLASREPGNPELQYYLGNALHLQMKLRESEVAYREAILLKPGLAEAHRGLGVVLSNQRRHSEAEKACREAIRIKPNLAEAHCSLGIVLADLHRPKEAEMAQREAIRLQSEFASAHAGLGSALSAQGRSREAETALREAIRLQPDNPTFHTLLGNSLTDQKRFRDAEALHREAIRLKPDYSDAYSNLGASLQMEGRLKEAEAAYREAIRLNPDSPVAHRNLGRVLGHQARDKEAEAAFRRALDLEYKHSEAHSGLGAALLAQGRFEKAESAFREAIRLNPSDALAYLGLALALKDQNKLEESVAALRKAEKISPGHPLIGNHLRLTKRWLELDKKLPAMLSGKEQLRTAQEQTEIAAFCAVYKKRYRAAANFYAAAFLAEPKLAGDLRFQHRYKAACAAALAADGKGEDAADLDDKERARLRQQARDWLAADLTFLAKLSDKKDAKANSWVKTTLQHWQSDPDLAALREPRESAKLTQTEREGWRKFWEEVEAVRKKASESP